MLRVVARRGLTGCNLMVNYQTQRLTGAADVTLAKSGMHLHVVRVYGGATPGTFAWLYDGAASAHFPSPTNATRGYAEYKVSYLVSGQTIPAAVFGFNGGTNVVELTFADAAPSGAPAIETFRALRFARTDAGAVTGDVTGNYAGGNASPKAVVVYTSASAGRVSFPPSGGMRQTVEALITDRQAMLMPAPGIPATASLTLSVVTDGASTIQAVVYY